MSRPCSVVVAILALALWSTPRAGATVLFEGTGSGLSATASFTISGAAGSRQLTTLLTNSDAASGDGAPTAANDVLTGLYSNLGTMAFTPVSGYVNGPDYDNLAVVDGIIFGVVPTGWVEGSANGLDNDLLVASAIRFVLNIPDGLEEDISSGGGSGSGGSVPEPATLSLLGIALAGASCRLRGRRVSCFLAVAADRSPGARAQTSSRWRSG